MLNRIVYSISVALIAVSSFAEALPCRLELFFDDKPHDVAWELRGPLPGIKLLAHAGYDAYDAEIFSGKSVTESFDLEEGKAYYFLITDYSQDGIEGGSFKLLATVPSGDIILEEGKGENIGSGRAVNFVVPVASDRIKAVEKR
jgi:hypothetical protein